MAPCGFGLCDDARSAAGRLRRGACGTGQCSPADRHARPDGVRRGARVGIQRLLIENWLEKDDRLRGSVTIAAQDPWAAAREIDRVGVDPRFVQVILPASTRDVFARSFYAPIFEAAVRNGLDLAFHHTNATETAVGLPPYYIEWHTAVS